MILLTVVGYLIGAGFTDYALRRGNDDDPLAPPRACAKIADPSLLAARKPQYSNEMWTIMSTDNLKLAATYFAPTEPSHRWAVLVHGYGRDQSFTGDYAEEYLKRGYNVLTPDLRAAGASEGEYLTMGTKESEDIALWTRKIAEVDPQAQIVLHGVSMGAATVMMTTAQAMQNVVAAVEDCGYTSAYDMFTAQLNVLFGLPEFPVMPCVDIVTRLKTGAAVSEAKPLDAVVHTAVPMLFIHGDADKLVPCAMAHELYEASNAPAKELFIVEGAGHADAKNVNPQIYFERIFAFLRPYVDAD